MRTLTLHKADVSNGYLVLVNRACPIKPSRLKSINTLAPCLAMNDEVLLERRAAASLIQLIDKVGCREQIVSVSGFRSKEEQEALFSNSLRQNGRTFTEQYVAYPNCSEHQTGLAIDLGENQDVIDFIRPSFPYTGIFAQFRSLAADYGFIERYGQGKEAITGISHEPWHFRYVGYPHAKIIKQHDFCLEEYIQFLYDYPFSGQHYTFTERGTQFDISYIRAIELFTTIEIPERSLYQLSGNNVDGFILTTWSAPQ